MAGEGKGGGWNSRGSSKIKVGATVELSLPGQADKMRHMPPTVGNCFHARTL